MRESVQSVKRAQGDRPLTHDPYKLRRRRVAAGLSNADLARAAECSPAHVSMLQKDDAPHSASPDQLRRFALALGCQIIDLMPDERTDGNAA